MEASYLAVIVAHELLHSINAWHHGEIDRQAKWRKGSDGILREFFDLGPSEGVEIRVLTEAGADQTDVYANAVGTTGGPVWIGRKQGQHSGFENCLMRYDNSNAYVSDADSKVRYSVREPVGHALCNTASGTGVNEPGRLPQARYGEASAGRGNCLQQLLVNDAVAAPRR
jgi:hypothetical protein